jgi:hypothetical protein
MANKALHVPAIPLCFMVAGEVARYPPVIRLMSAKK